MKLVLLTIRGISYSQTQTGAYALILNEVEGKRTLPIVIGANEAHSIAIALDDETRPPRPLTHDLIKTLSDSFTITISKIVINKLEEGVFYSMITFEQDGIQKEMDSRTSDAIALSIRFNAPVFTYESVLEKAGMFLGKSSTLEDAFNEPEKVEVKEEKPESLTLLHKKLKEAIVKEDYEKAAQLRDEIQKRTEG